MTVRNVVCISHIDPEVHEWFQHEATRRSQKIGKRVALWQVVEEALKEFKASHTDKVEVLHG